MIETLMTKNVPLGILKKLCCHRNLSSLRKPIGRTLRESNVNVKDHIQNEVKQGVSLIENYPQQHAIPWEQVSKSLTEFRPSSNEFVQNVIIKSCAVLKNPDIMMSYYKYVLDTGGSFSQINLYLIVKLLSSSSPASILKHEDIVLDLYNQCRDLIQTSEVFQIHGVDIFSCIPQCYKELLQLVLKNPDFPGKDHLAARAFDFDDEAMAWKILQSGNPCLGETVLKSFINYCIKLVIENKFSIDLIQKLVNICQEKGLIFQTSDINCLLQPLMSVLTFCHGEYVWSARTSFVNDQMECINCSTLLKEVKLSSEEFQRLKNAVYEILFSNDVFLKSTYKELSEFKNFLKNCRPYDFVVDGLNFIYRGILPKKQRIIPYVFEKYVKRNNLKLLVIMRKHFENSNFFKSLPNIQYFHTDNLSDDDLFTIYAALHGGPGTGFMTCDFLNTHTAKLDLETRILFLKWQYFHQYIIDSGFGVVLPNKHAGLPQCTESPETGGKSYKWHLSFQSKSSLYSFRPKIDWICVQAKPREDLHKPSKILKTLREISGHYT